MSEVSYLDFLDRVHVSEIKLREKGLWHVPHPWLNLLVPRSSIHQFSKQVFHRIVKDTSNGPILIYPVNKSRYGSKFEKNNTFYTWICFLNLMNISSPQVEKRDFFSNSERGYLLPSHVLVLCNAFFYRKRRVRGHFSAKQKDLGVRS